MSWNITLINTYLLMVLGIPFLVFLIIVVSQKKPANSQPKVRINIVSQTPKTINKRDDAVATTYYFSNEELERRLHK